MNAARDFDTAATRFLNALRRTGEGLELQRQRILDRAAAAPELLPNDPTSAVLLTGPDNDLDYYIYELSRLNGLGESIIKVFGKPNVRLRPDTLINAQNDFRAAIPALRDIRNALTHPNDNDQLDDYVTFSAGVRLRPDGKVDYLVDPRYQHHEAAQRYLGQLQAYLREHVRAAIAARDEISPADGDEDRGTGLD